MVDLQKISVLLMWNKEWLDNIIIIAERQVTYYLTHSPAYPPPAVY